VLTLFPFLARVFNPSSSLFRQFVLFFLRCFGGIHLFCFDGILTFSAPYCEFFLVFPLVVNLSVSGFLRFLYSMLVFPRDAPMVDKAPICQIQHVSRQLVLEDSLLSPLPPHDNLVIMSGGCQLVPMLSSAPLKRPICVLRWQRVIPQSLSWS